MGGGRPAEGRPPLNRASCREVITTTTAWPRARRRRPGGGRLRPSCHGSASDFVGRYGGEEFARSTPRTRPRRGQHPRRV